MKERQCFPCTACCDGWLTAEINGVKIGPGNPCAHSTGRGCAIYEKRPENPCKSFKCAWLVDEEQLPEHMKPVECGAIILFDRKYQGNKIISAVPVGSSIPADTLEWLMAFAREHTVPLVYSENSFENGKLIKKKTVGYGPPAFVEAVKNEILPQDVKMY